MGEREGVKKEVGYRDALARMSGGGMEEILIAVAIIPSPNIVLYLTVSMTRSVI